MKFSLNLQQDDLCNSSPLFKAKLPISIFDYPFTSIFTTPTHSISDLCVAVSTNFSSGPSLRFTYSPSSASLSNPFSPFSVSLKSGLGLFGSPRDSPLVFSANFAISNSTPNSIVPSFCLHFKPQLGHFSLHKTSSASSNPLLNSGFETRLQTDSTGSSDSESGNGSIGWQEVKLEPFVGKQKLGFASDDGGVEFSSDRQMVWLGGKKEGLLTGAAVKAKTELPISKRVKVNLRWVLKLPANLGTKMPTLTVNKITAERMEEVKEVKAKKNDKAAEVDLKMMKEMCFWMKKDLEIIERENRDLKQCLEEMKHGVTSAYSPASTDRFTEFERRNRTSNEGSRKTELKKPPASAGRFTEFEQRNKTSNEGNRKSELKKPTFDFERELEKAIKAAAS